MKKKQNVAAYCRVSTLSEHQEFSLLHQTEYYREHIKGNPEFNFAGVYADQMSGKSVDKRKQFKQLLKACRNGEVQMVLTKSISRFARNLCETLEVVRELRQLGVGIVFEKESINTLDPTSDLKLSLYAAFAEKELDSLSGNIRWAARKRYKEGQVEFNTTYGYRYLGDKKHEIIPDEAAVVKEVFERYINGEGGRRIAVSLNDRAVKKKVSDKPWASSDVLRIVKCEKYTGNAILQKTVTDENYKKVKNTGQAPQYYVENNHPAIISQETFDKANAILDSRKWKRESRAPVERSPITGKIKCGCCGTGYNLRKQHRQQSIIMRRWECARYSSSGKASCPDSKSFKDSEFKELFLSAYNEAVDGGAAESKPMVISEALQDLLAQERELTVFRAKGYIPRQAYHEEQEKLVAQIKELEQEYTETTKREGWSDMKSADEYSDDLIKFLKEVKAEVLTLTFEFINGATVSRELSHYRRKVIKEEK